MGAFSPTPLRNYYDCPREPVIEVLSTCPIHTNTMACVSIALAQRCSVPNKSPPCTISGISGSLFATTVVVV